MKIFGKNIKSLFLVIIGFLLVIDVGLAVWYNSITVPEKKTSSKKPMMDDEEQAQGWTGFPKVDDFKVTAKSPSMDGNYVVAGPWEDCKPDRTESRKLKCFSQKTGKEVSMDKCKGIDFPKSRSCNYNKDCVSTGETSYVCNDCSVAKDGKNPCNKGYECNKKKTECVQNCKSYFKSYSDVGEAFDCGCSSKNTCPKDYKCMNGVCVKNIQVTNEFKSSDYCFSEFGSETRKPSGESWCRAFNPKIYTPASGASPVFQSVMSEFLKQNPKENFDANNPEEFMEKNASKYFNKSYLVPCSKINKWKSVSPTKEVLDAINQPLKGLDSSVYNRSKVTVQNFNKQYCVAQKFDDGKYGPIPVNTNKNYPYCSKCRLNSFNCLTSACKSPSSQGVPGKCNNDGSCDCRPTGGYSGATCEKDPLCKNNSKTIYESNNHTFKGCDCTKPSSLNKKKDSRVLNYGNLCQNTVDNNMCYVSPQLSMPKNWGQGKGYKWLVDSTATIDNQNRAKWHNTVPVAQCNGRKGLVRSDIQIACASNQYESPNFDKKECCMNVCGKKLDLTKKGSQLVKVNNYGINDYFVYRYPGNDVTKPYLGSWNQIDVSSSAVEDKELAAAIILVSHLDSSEREKYLAKKPTGGYELLRKNLMEDYPALEFDGCLSECLKVTGAPPIDKEDDQLECNHKLTSLDQYNETTHKDAAFLCACKGVGVNPYNKNQCQNNEHEMCITDKFGTTGSCSGNLVCGNNIDEMIEENYVITEKNNGEYVSFKLLNYDDSEIFSVNSGNLKSKNNISIQQERSLYNGTKLFLSNDIYYLDGNNSKEPLTQKGVSKITQIIISTPFKKNLKNKFISSQNIKNNVWTPSDDNIVNTKIINDNSYLVDADYYVIQQNIDKGLLHNQIRVESKPKNNFGVLKINYSASSNKLQLEDDSGNTVFTVDNFNVKSFNKLSSNPNSNYSASGIDESNKLNYLHYKNKKGNWWPLFSPNTNSFNLAPNGPTELYLRGKTFKGDDVSNNGVNLFTNSFWDWSGPNSQVYGSEKSNKMALKLNTPTTTGKDILGRLRPFITTEAGNNNGGYSYCKKHDDNSTFVNHMYPIKMPENNEKLSTTAPQPYISSDKNLESGSFAGTPIISSSQPYNIINGNIEDPNFLGTYHKILDVKDKNLKTITSIPSGLYKLKSITSDNSKKITTVKNASFMMGKTKIGDLLEAKSWGDIAQLGFDISKFENTPFIIPTENNIKITVDSPNLKMTDKPWPKNDKNQLVDNISGITIIKLGKNELNPIQISFSIPFYSSEIDTNVIKGFDENLGPNFPSIINNYVISHNNKVSGYDGGYNKTWENWATILPGSQNKYPNPHFDFTKSNLIRPKTITSVDNYDNKKLNGLSAQQNEIYALPSLTYQDNGNLNPTTSKLWDSGTYCSKIENRNEEICNLSNSPLRQNFSIPLKSNYNVKNYKSDDKRYTELIHSNDIVNTNTENLKYFLQKKQVPFIPKSEKNSNLTTTLKKYSNFWQPWYNNNDYASLVNENKAMQIYTSKNYSYNPSASSDIQSMYYKRLFPPKSYITGRYDDKGIPYDFPIEYKQKSIPNEKLYMDHFLEINPLYKSQYSANNRKFYDVPVQEIYQKSNETKVSPAVSLETGSTIYPGYAGGPLDCARKNKNKFGSNYTCLKNPLFCKTKTIDNKDTDLKPVYKSKFQLCGYNGGNTSVKTIVNDNVNTTTVNQLKSIYPKIQYLSDFKGYNNSCKNNNNKFLGCYLDRVEEFYKGKLMLPFQTGGSYNSQTWNWYKGDGYALPQIGYNWKGSEQYSILQYLNDSSWLY